MRFMKALFAVLVLFLVAGKGTYADVNVGLSVDDEGLKSFYLSIGEHYQASEKEIIVTRGKKISDDELPVIFFMARQAGVEPGVIVKLRLEGKSCIEISAHLGLSPEIYYVAFKNDPGPPYGKAWGYFKKKKNSEWKTIQLTNVDIINFVNIKFMSERYGYSPDEIVKLREKDQSFVYLNSKIKKHKKEKQKQIKLRANAEKAGKGATGEGNGKGKSKKDRQP